MNGFEHAALQFVHAYGYVALFVLLALETSMILHFVPSEAIVTVAAAALATDKTRLVLVILVSTLGATAGSLMLYAFARFGGRRFLDRHPRFFGLNAKRRERLERWFQRPAGESLVFFLRLLPFFRAAVSLPAGLARMDVRRFTIYSAAGSALFNAALAYSTFAVRANPRQMAEIRTMTASAVSHWPFLLALAAIVLLGLYILYRRRRMYRRAPKLIVRHVVRTSAIAAVAGGVIVLGFALFAPEVTYRAVTWMAVNTRRLMQQYGVSELLFLLGIALGVVTLGLLALSALPLERKTRALYGRLRRSTPKR